MVELNRSAPNPDLDDSSDIPTSGYHSVGNVYAQGTDKLGSDIVNVGEKQAHFDAGAGIKALGSGIAKGAGGILGGILGGIGDMIGEATAPSSTEEQSGLISQASADQSDIYGGAEGQAQLQNLIGKAGKRLKKGAAARLKQTTDAAGNPTFDQVDGDLSHMGADIMKDYLPDIANGAVKQDFQNQFNQQINNTRFQALKQTRQNRYDYANKGLSDGLNNLYDEASSDQFLNVPQYEGQALGLVGSAVNSGLVHPDDAHQIVDNFSKGARMGSLSNMIQTDPAAAHKFLQQPPEALGLDDNNVSQLQANAQTQIDSDERTSQGALNQSYMGQLNNSASLRSHAEGKIDAGAMSQAELYSLQNKLDPSVHTDLSQKYINSLDKDLRQRVNMADLGTAIQKGLPLTNFTSADIDNHYSQMVNAAIQQNQKPLSLQQKAEIASIYQAPVSRFTSEINTSLINGQLDQATDALRAYTYAQDRNPASVSGKGISKQASMIAQQAEFLSSKGGMDPTQAMQMARNVVLNATDQDRQGRATYYKSNYESGKDSPFSPVNVAATAQEDLGSNPGFIKRMFGAETVNIPPDVARTYGELVKDAYVGSGDINGAKSWAQEQIKQTHGVSTINGKPEFMYAPPEQTLSGAPIEGVRSQFQDNMKEAGFNADHYSLVSDHRTRGQTLMYTDANGAQQSHEVVSYGIVDSRTGMPVINPDTQQQRRYYPDLGSIVQKQNEKELGLKAALMQSASQSDKEYRDRQAAFAKYPSQPNPTGINLPPHDLQPSTEAAPNTPESKPLDTPNMSNTKASNDIASSIFPQAYAGSRLPSSSAEHDALVNQIQGQLRSLKEATTNRDRTLTGAQYGESSHQFNQLSDQLKQNLLSVGLDKYEDPNITAQKEIYAQQNNNSNDNKPPMDWGPGVSPGGSNSPEAQQYSRDHSSSPELYRNPTEEVQKAISFIKEAAKKTHPDNKTMGGLVAAQAILNSRFAQEMGVHPAIKESNNVFGYRGVSPQGKYINVSSSPQSMSVGGGDKFRSYDNLSQAFHDHAMTIMKPEYGRAVAADNVGDAAGELQRLGYSSDPEYQKKIMDIYNNYVADDDGYFQKQALDNAGFDANMRAAAKQQQQYKDAYGEYVKGNASEKSGDQQMSNQANFNKITGDQLDKMSKRQANYNKAYKSYSQGNASAPEYSPGFSSPGLEALNKAYPDANSQDQSITNQYNMNTDTYNQIKGMNKRRDNYKKNLEMFMKYYLETSKRGR